jgi:hypothetical protein
MNGGNYSRKVVVLDGYSWINADFDGATLYYDGTAATELINCQVVDATLTSHSKAVAQTIAIMIAFQKARSATTSPESRSSGETNRGIPHGRRHGRGGRSLKSPPGL